ncbi:Nucleoside triphosphate pyrophosphohydrolase MazG [Patulibacter medicamentivorans]|uniref:Nucleoside triphosphate pyrophosphohydrolase MazG n=1 Tax=Patulibacter medicamentivorans TaxID=1097667 RepID=H0EAP4_9ACTN|nr:nucleoside triphosphate pyrophosphohydrolase [Patulibacter medicamentivorans]EHN09219.1 Nucleoside triphosphate pyrophosphohydrolase MazG [Patulibacter medicamentivorans]
MPRDEITHALGALDDLTRRLRVECPWDREQDERTIVPHTLEEAYELADAANQGDDGKLLDELGDVLFQVHFLSLLLEERGAGDLGQVAEHCRQKLISRHPHVFGDVEVADAGEVLRNWDRLKQDEPGRERGIFGEVPDNLPSLLFARKVQRRAASSGFDPTDVETALDAARAQLDALAAALRQGARHETFAALGDALFAVVNVARKAKADPEIALRSSSARFRERVLVAERLAAEEGLRWTELPEDDRLAYYARAVLAEQQGGGDVAAD